jgi:hypothetical protein
MESFKLRGEWWLPDQEEERINGVLEFEPREGGSLKLDGAFDSDFIEPELIHGRTTENKKLTLQRCHQVRSSGLQLEGSMETSTFKVERIFKQGHLNEVKFDKVQVEFPYLDTWMSKRTITEYPPQDGGRFEVETEKFTYTVSYQDVEISIIAGTKQGGGDGFHIDKSCFIEIRSEEKLDYETFSKYISHLKDFLNLTSGEDVSPNSITCYISEGVKVSEDEYLPQRTNVFRRVSQDYRGEENKAVQLMLTPFQVFEDDLSSVLTSWLDMRQGDKMKWALNLYFGIRYNDSMYVNQRLLNIIQALEVYYDFNNEGKYMPENDFKKQVRDDLYEQIPDNIDEEIQETPEDVSSLEERLKTAIKHCYKYSLTDKLMQCYKSQENTYLNLDIDEELIRKAKKTRDHYTHFSKDEDEILSSEEMPETIVKFRAMMELNILLELGLDEEMATDRIVNYYLQHYGLGR